MLNSNRSLEDALTFIIFNLPKNCFKDDVKSVLRQLDGVNVSSVNLNPKASTAFVVLSEYESLEKVWFAAKANRIVIHGQVMKRCIAKDEATEKVFQHLLEEKQDEGGAVEESRRVFMEPDVSFIQVVLDKGISKTPYFPVPKHDKADHIGFVMFWKSLVFEETRCQLLDIAARSFESFELEEDSKRWYDVTSQPVMSGDKRMKFKVLIKGLFRSVCLFFNDD